MNYVVNNHNILEILIVTYIVSFILVLVSKKLAVHLDAMDYPNARKVHKVPTPRIGGIAIFGSFLFGYIMYGSLTTQMLSVLIGAFIIFFLGFLDDMKPLRAKDKFLVQIVAAAIVVFYGKLYFDELTILGSTIVFPKFISQLISLFFILGAINAINLIDGLDGLCAGTSTIYFITVAIIAFALNKMQGLDVTLCLIMIGATLGYLTHNFPPAKTFMGDCGSTFLGFMIAVIALLGFKVTTITSFVIPLVILAIPIFDTLLAILRRIVNHKPIGEPDKAHFHHQILRMKFSTRTTVLIIYGINMLFSAVSIFYALGDNRAAIYLYIILMLLLIYIVARTDILFEHKKKSRREK